MWPGRVPGGGRLSVRTLAKIVVAALLVGCLTMMFGCTSEPKDGGKPSAEVKLTTVKLKDFKKALESQRGKVVLVDIWGEF